MESIPNEKITAILQAACAAPSGDNSQPWRFLVRPPNRIEFHYVKDKDNPILNVDNSGTLIALGAAIENALLEARGQGFAAELEYHFENSLVAAILLKDGGSATLEEQGLRSAIFKRHTNRKPYREVPLTSEDRQTIVEAGKTTTNMSLILVESKTEMFSVSRALTTMEEIALSNKALHTLFFADIFWSEERNVRGEHGLYIKTLELPPPVQMLFRALRHWSVARVLAALRFPTVVAEINAKQNIQASAMGVLIANELDSKTYVETGRLIQRIWLTATARGLAFQIVTGLLFLARATSRSSSTTVFAPREQTQAKNAYERIHKELHLNGSVTPVISFRLGYAEDPTAVSKRLQPVVDYQ